MKKLIFLAIAPVVLSGCIGATLKPATEEYCDAFSPLEQTVFRARMDQQTSPHQVRINCYALSYSTTDKEDSEEQMAIDK